MHKECSRHFQNTLHKKTIFFTKKTRLDKTKPRCNYNSSHFSLDGSDFRTCQYESVEKKMNWFLRPLTEQGSEQSDMYTSLLSKFFSFFWRIFWPACSASLSCTLAFLPQLQPPIDHNFTSTLPTHMHKCVQCTNTKYSIKFWNILPFLELCPAFIQTFENILISVSEVNVVCSLTR